MGLTPCYLHSQVVSTCQSVRPVAPFFLAKVQFLDILIAKRGVAI